MKMKMKTIWRTKEEQSEKRRSEDTIWKTQIRRYDLENADPKKKNRDLEWRTQKNLKNEG